MMLEEKRDLEHSLAVMRWWKWRDHFAGSSEFDVHLASLGLHPIWTLRFSACFLYNSYAGLRPPPDIISGRVATLGCSRSAHHYQSNFHQ